MNNELIHAKSPYLLQHAHNPVQWHEWNDASIELARTKNLPIFLSIGYSTCHWCHVMERESFENDSIAQLMNDNFICIKVDREERPDIDRVYMTFVQATNNGQGGWPMSVFLTPTLEPFFGGTYFPPRDAYGRPGFPTLLQSIARSWDDDRENIDKIAENAAQFLQRAAAKSVENEDNAVQWEAVFSGALQQFASEYDPQWGGFGDAPKFPRPVTHDFLHRAHAAIGAPNAIEMSQRTLEAMCRGGMRDHLGGGFHRYSVDAQWIVSHFEKMLYDQAQLTVSLLEIGQISGDKYFHDMARSTLDYVLRDLTHQSGGFFAGEDADSLPNENAAQKIEGAFYVWTESEIDSALGENAALFKALYHVQSKGNAPREGDPHGEFRGQNILFEGESLEKISAQFSLAEDAARAILLEGRDTLFAIRAQRPRPHRDEKIITAWNGLMISAFAQAGAILNKRKYLQAAIRAAEFIENELFDAKAGTLQRHYKDGASPIGGFADDYAFLVRGLLDLWEASGQTRWLEWAQVLAATQTLLFWDEQNGGYFSAPADPHVLVRDKESYDGAEPSSHSISAQNDVRLAQLLDDEHARARAELSLPLFSERLRSIPSTMPALLCAALQFHSAPQHIVLVGDKESEDFQELERTIYQRFLPFAALIKLHDDNREVLGELMPFVREMTMRDGRATAYVCRDFACQAPVTEADKLAQLL